MTRDKSEILAEIERLKSIVRDCRASKDRRVEAAWAAAQIQALAWAIGESASPRHRVEID